MLTKEQVLPGKKDTIAATPLPSLKELDKIVADFDAKVWEIKKRVDIFETNHEAQTAAKELQEATRQVLHRRFGPDDPYPYRVVVDLEFQNTISDFAEHGSSGSFTIELAPSSLQPHSIHTFLEIARQWHGGAFHRIAGHVLQVMVAVNSSGCASNKRNTSRARIRTQNPAQSKYWDRGFNTNGTGWRSHEHRNSIY